MASASRTNPPRERAQAAPYFAEAACYKKQIDHPTDPSRNHPIHDEVEKIEYGDGRWVIALTLDGVSETKSQKKLVPIGRMLAWDFAKFCQTETPETMDAIVDWFRATTRNPHYAGQGATTVSLIRFDRRSGIVDGINVGDSVPLMVVDRATRGADGSAQLSRRGVVLSPLHSVPNDPRTVYKCWRSNSPFEPDGFRLALPKAFTSVWLVTMSDGFARISDAVATQLYDFRLIERVLARRYPDFVRVYLPTELAPLAPDVKRPKRGRVRFSAVRDNRPLQKAFAEHYMKASREERREMEIVDLDTMFLHTLVSAKNDPDREILGKTVEQHRASGHRTLRWLMRAPLSPRTDDRGIEVHLRQYSEAEFFSEAMIRHIQRDVGGEDSLTSRLRAFMEGLGQIGDDFCVAMIQVQRATSDPRAAR
ncbi:MAG: hypothetical protein ABI333_07215 [bacterium]